MKASHFVFPMGIALLGTAACDGGETTTAGGSAGSAGSAGSTATGGSAGSAGSTGTAGTGGASAGSAGSGGSAGTSSGPLCTMPTPVACSDQVILDMNLQKDPVKAAVTSMADGTGWISNVDATAGGAFAPMPTSFTYAKFDATGLTRVDIGDEASLTSMDWDIAFRRYVIRINSGDSGPSCVQAAPVPGKKFEEVTAVPDQPSYHADDYFTDSCDFIPDGSGLDNSPATALSGYWTYPGCVKMTNIVFVIELASGKHVKFTVDDYYSPAVQMQCDTTGMVPMMNTGSANFVVRWAFLD